MLSDIHVHIYLSSDHANFDQVDFNNETHFSTVAEVHPLVA
jgi:hypothetical protein